MSATPPPKFVALNATAARRQQYVVGNPVNTRLEAGVGNCFPGLEMDLRNLERRFFPFLEVDFITAVEDNQPPPHIPNTIEVVAVDLDGVNGSALPGAVQAAYAAIAADVNGGNSIWRIEQISGEFGLFGSKTLRVRTLSATNAVVNGTPPDGWTAVRLLPEGKPITITIVRDGSDGPGSQFTITQNRVSYLDENGSFNQVFEPGELSQSLCSPWTHDFRDCACFYWASNHPDIVLPPAPETVPDDQRWRLSVPWERLDRGTPDNPSAPALEDGPGERELDYYEINRRWQELDIVVEGRELRRSYQSGILCAAPFATLDELEANLRYAAGIERAAVQTYLSAAFSLNPLPADAGSLRVDSATSFAELMRVAVSEMRHLRIVNDVLREITARLHPGTVFRAALQIAPDFPASFEHPRPVPERRLTPEVLEEFIDVEKPSDTLDGLYARIFVSLSNFSFPNPAQMIRSVMADGFDHYETFLDVREWLGRHRPNDYLLDLRQPAPDDSTHKHLQELLLLVLQTLRQGYTLGLPRGGEDIARARGLMLQNGLLTACEGLRSKGLMVVFDPITSDSDFGTVARPPSTNNHTSIRD